MDLQHKEIPDKLKFAEAILCKPVLIQGNTGKFLKNGGEKESGFFGKAKDQSSWWVIYPLCEEEGVRVCVQSLKDEA